MPAQTLIQVRQGTAAQWSAASPVTLSSGEFGYDTTNNLLKIGNGGTVWSNLVAIGTSTDQLTAGTLGVNRGGTGANTFTAGVLYSTGGTSAVSTLNYSATPTDANNLVLTGTNGSITAGSGGISTSGTASVNTLAANQGSTPTVSVKAASTAFSTTIQANSTLAANNTVTLPSSAGTLALTSSPTFTGTVYLPTGTSSAAPLDFNPGTLLSTPVSGAVEYDGKAFYGTTAGYLTTAARGYIPTEYFIISTSDKTISGFTTNTYPIFDSTNTSLGGATAGATLTLPTGTYFFECQLYITTLSSTTGNINFSLLNSTGSATSTNVGSATIGTVTMHAVGSDTSTPTTAQAQGGSFWQVATTTTGYLINTTGTGTQLYVTITGVFRVTGAGTIVPSFSAPNTGVSPVIKTNSWFRVRAIGDSTVSAVGPWQ